MCVIWIYFDRLIIDELSLQNLKKPSSISMDELHPVYPFVPLTKVPQILILPLNNHTIKHRMYQRKVDVDMLTAIKSVLADVLSISPSSKQN